MDTTYVPKDGMWHNFTVAQEVPINIESSTPEDRQGELAKPFIAIKLRKAIGHLVGWFDKYQPYWVTPHNRAYPGREDTSNHGGIIPIGSRGNGDIQSLLWKNCSPFNHLRLPISCPFTRTVQVDSKKDPSVTGGQSTTNVSLPEWNVSRVQECGKSNGPKVLRTSNELNKNLGNVILECNAVGSFGFSGEECN
jgi:hypothetical protein